eukprot:Sspe_Gene.15544::Locus_5410_Transcript_1_1_Confidence_1.000_Length_3642::g.15544::m.15544
MLWLVFSASLVVCHVAAAPVQLRQQDFDQGTYRITTPGTYKLMEDVEFAPHPENDYWVPDNLRGTYPYAQYYLGFFAAITVECNDVTIDLNGHTLRQGKEFYLLQRFFNVIELNDRVFVDNEGVSSLNYQKGDRVVPESGGVSQGLVTVSDVVIKNGVLGRSSHAGIHGNSARNVVVRNVKIRDFEVAGVQCNGCQEVSVFDCVVGPTSREVPVLATFAHARFMELYGSTVIPQGFARDPMASALTPLLDESITFADRTTGTTVRAVFARLRRGLQLFRDHHMGRSSQLSTEDQALLDEAIKVFQNPSGLTDGGVVYGLFFNKVGVSDIDDNHYKAGTEARNIAVWNTKVVGLHASPLEVPNLVTQSGHHIQGPARDVLRIFDMVSDELRSLVGTRYKGDFVADSYFAMWKLSNAFYKTRVFLSECGNFGSNATMPYNLIRFPSAAIPTCAAHGTSQDPTLTGRQVTMLQKRYFGGLTMSQGVYEWATVAGTTLDSVLMTPLYADRRRQSRHMIRCDQDTMFHTAHGVVAIKVVQARNVEVRHVTIADIVNTADLNHWVCREGKWELPANGEEIQPVRSVLKEDGATVRGIELVRSEDVVLRDVDIKDLNSHEGRVTGIEVEGDTNDRSEHNDDTGVRLWNCRVRRLKSGGGPTTGAEAFKAVGTSVNTGGLTVGPPTELGAGLGNRRVMIHYEMDSTVSSAPGGGPDFASVFEPEDLQAFYRLSSFNTEAKAKSLRARAIAHFKSFFGLHFPENTDSFGLLEPIPVLDDSGAPTDSIVIFQKIRHNADYHVRTVCTSSGDNEEQTCLADQNARIHDWWFGVAVGTSGLTLRGVFSKDEGQFATPGALMIGGVYVIDNLNIPGLSQDRKVEVMYFSLCPILIDPAKANQLVTGINCALESSLFGKGIATGSSVSTLLPDGRYKLQTGPTMFFDDQVSAPQPSAAVASPPTTYQFQKQAWQFRFSMDGTYPIHFSSSELFPLTDAHHFTHEAGVDFLKRKTSINTNTLILQLRTQFLERLKTEFGIAQIRCATCYDDVPLDGVVDLGGGNHIVAYEVNEAANFRLTSKYLKGSGDWTPMPQGSRIHEGGFRLLTGRAGINTTAGHLPYGSLLHEGVYLLEDDGAEWEFTFHSDIPTLSNTWAMSIASFKVHSPVFGEGRMSYLVPMPHPSEKGITHGIHGYIASLSYGEFQPPTQ